MGRGLRGKRSRGYFRYGGRRHKLARVGKSWLLSVVRATSVTNWRSPETPPKLITRTNQLATCDAPVLTKAHLDSPRQPRLGIHGASQDLP